ncbi:MAG TPA: WD40 repeat domain-containing serine/threonine protein kinase [Thermoanaerobaculia bacterium]|nr:WD40 repeat domain-containing serine/threonine protein kinase [Thermoanaerobaculia bacterium]
MTLTAGTKLGAYEIVAPLGAGGMGEVYRARDPRLGRDVAVKVLPSAFAESEERLRRFEQEARAAGVLSHPNLLTVFDVGTHERMPFIVSELLEGETLRERLLQGALPIRRAIGLAVQIAAGVAAAHEKSIVHRDLKPENIFITGDDRIKLLDFGLAKVLADADHANDAPTVEIVTGAGTVLGTPGYMSPEQVHGQPLDVRTDIFSFGVVLLEMLTGVGPFRRESRMATLNATLTDDPAFPPGFPAAFERVVRHALEKKASQRFQSMRDVAFALETFSVTSDSTPAAQKRVREKRAAPPKLPTFQKLTFHRGYIMTARFARDGSIVYGAAWEDRPLEIFAATPGDPHSRSLGLPTADVLSVSPSTGELAISLDRRFVAGWVSIGTLARVPAGGGAPREVCEAVQEAEWGPDGRNFIIIRRADAMFTIEYPIGKRLYASTRWLSHLRLSPKGDLLAFIEHPIWGDDAGSVVVIDFEGNPRARSQSWGSTAGLAWTPRGDEVWTAGGVGDGTRPLFSLALSGRERVVFPVPGHLSLLDIAPNGDVLLSYDHVIREVIAGRRGGESRNLSWFDWSFLTGISNDGSRIVFEEQQTMRGQHPGIYVRKLDGSPAVHLGEGHAHGFSPDGKWVLVRPSGGSFELVPVGAGEARPVACHGLEDVLWWQWLPDGKRVLLWGNAPGEGTGIFELAIDGDGTARRIGAANVADWLQAVSPDGQHLAATNARDETLFIQPLAGNEEPVPVRGSRPGDHPVLWSEDGGLYVHQIARTNALLERIDLTTGERTPWHELRPADVAGVSNVQPVFLAKDRETYAFSYRRMLSEMFLARNLIG